MSQTAWMLTDPTTGEVSYLKFGMPGTSDERTIGPFAYSKAEDAQKAANGIPLSTDTFALLEVDTSAFVHALFNGFPGSGTDVLVLDDGFFPLSPGGATWVDKQSGRPQWARLFDEEGGSGLAWLNRVLFQVGDRLGLSLKEMQAIGEMVTAEDDVADEVEQAKRMIQENVKVAVIPELDPALASGALVPVETTFWLHTQGMSKLGLPELEIRGVPAWWVTAAGAELNAWAAYSTQHPIKDGQTLQGGGPVPVLLRAQRSQHPAWKDQECLQLLVEQVVFPNPAQPHTLH